MPERKRFFFVDPFPKAQKTPLQPSTALLQPCAALYIPLQPITAQRILQQSIKAFYIPVQPNTCHHCPVLLITAHFSPALTITGKCSSKNCKQWRLCEHCKQCKGRVPLTNGMNFWKSSKGGRGFIFNPKIYVADFGNLKQGFWAWNWYKIIISGFRVCMKVSEWITRQDNDRTTNNVFQKHLQPERDSRESSNYQWTVELLK